MIQENKAKTSTDIKQELALVRRLSEIVARASDIDRVYQAFALELKSYVGADWAAVILIENNKVQVFPLDKKPVNQAKATLPLSETTLGRMVASKKAIVETGPTPPACGWLGCPDKTKSIVWSPLVVKDKVFGALAVASFGGGVPGERQLALLEHITNLLALAVRNSKLQEENEATKRQETERMSFMDVLVHELKTPLTAIIASAGLLKDELEGRIERVQMRIIENINKSAQNLDSRLSELGEFAQARVGAFRLQPELSTIEPLLRGAVSQVTPMARRKGQALSLQLPPPLPQVRVDRRRLEQVLLHLLSNAIKFTPEGGSITVRAKVGDDDLVVEVQDSSVPIPEEEQQRLFEPYYRIEADRERLPGLGLGLAVSKQLIEAHGGKIWLKSKAGEGNTFAFSLPRADTAPHGSR